MRMPIPLFISLGMLITMTFLSLGLWAALPAETMLPIHFDFSGNPDNFARPTIALFLLPGAMLFAVAVFVVSPSINPKALDRPGLYTAIWLFVILALAVAHGFIIRGALFALQALQG
ncbi:MULTISPECIES: DUF1648 domain-containing protein [Rhizobiaceae]|jgi:hypothetical protein|uniref:DUF1648 domain-containing protein n=2 Tax=Rhizobiaceae TaxID=82115 RepID=A0A7W4SP51_9HYPH|nr:MULTISPECIES: DUF1648 domain-containing protein [Rhizobium/Agrobacterium group]MBB4346785.1 hypothetical protein [Rhizobium cellulosilyticum]MBB4410821.1 hypothetical protein [Rhizobium cellulosilyticum]MBB4445509.1 hypothetical protein [Rhizobium cellulosilyticum]MBB6161404.1 hypothetical protein [Rhizobium wenxiniae]MBO0139731.1 DUF1648 domain-containing protein [Agrobacterium sp. Ap1]